MSNAWPQGAQNFRAVEGFVTRGGRQMRAGLVYRSGELCDLSDAGLVTAGALGVSDIIDLRAPERRGSRATRWPDMPAATRWSRDGATSVGELHAMLVDPGATAEAVRTQMIAIYRALPDEQRDHYRIVFERLADSEGAVLIHCTAGKDRTGIIVAFLLDALGVPRGEIEEEFMLTDRCLPALTAMVRADPAHAMMAEDALLAMMRADPAYLRAAFEAVEARHGSTRAYREEVLGVDDRLLDRIAERLLEPAGAIG